ncbi:MAG: ATP-binding protein [Ktedonobacterales bacterium]|nr:ATP-binding protein [Ktedonobacterales bacterium]
MSERKAHADAARAAYTGTCYDCQDTGRLAQGPFLVPCSQCEQGRARFRVEEAAHRAETVREYLVRGGVPTRRLAQTFDTYPMTTETAAAVAALRGFTQAWDGTRGLILKGVFGTGKTGLLIAALRELVTHYVPQYTPRPSRSYPIYNGADIAPLWFTTSTDFFDTLRGGYADGSYAHSLARAKQVKLLALDDIGVEQQNEWVQERLFSVVNERYEREMPICLTTNYGLKALGERIGARILERLIECCDVVEVDGVNLRKR